MAEITSSDSVKNKIHQFDDYIGQSLDVLKTLHVIKGDAKQQLHSINTKLNEITSKQKEIDVYFNKAKSIFDQADTIVAKINSEKRGLEDLRGKMNTELARLESTLDKKLERIVLEYDKLINGEIDKCREARISIENGLISISETLSKTINDEFNVIQKSQTEFQQTVNSSIESVRNDLEIKLNNFLAKQNVLITNLSQQIDSYIRLTESLKTSVENQILKVTQLEYGIETLFRKIDNQGEVIDTKINEFQEGMVKPIASEVFQLRAEIKNISTKLEHIRLKNILFRS